MSGLLQEMRIAFLVAPEGAEQIELTEPWRRVLADGGQADLVSTDSGTIQAFNHLDRGATFNVDTTVNDATADDFDALVLPGGVANPDILRMDDAAVSFTRGFFDAGKTVGVICHGAWTLVEADVVRRRSLTSWPSLRTDITNAGGMWVDQEVVVCKEGAGTLISSRNPDDLGAFCPALMRAFAAER